MVLILDEDASFSMTANVTTPGYQRVVLSGYLKSTRHDGVYVAPLIPQLFYGADGNPLTSWRQHLPTAGSQVILSRSMGLPMVPREDLWWRKISNFEEERELEAAEVKPLQDQVIEWWNGLTVWEQASVIAGAAIGGVAIGYGAYALSQR